MLFFHFFIADLPLGICTNVRLAHFHAPCKCKTISVEKLCSLAPLVNLTQSVKNHAGVAHIFAMAGWAVAYKPGLTQYVIFRGNVNAKFDTATIRQRTTVEQLVI